MTYVNTNDFNIFADNAQFKIWAWGGEYGGGQWVEITSIDVENRTFVFSLYDNCDGFMIVRLNPNKMPEEVDAWGRNTEAWNQTETLFIDAGGRLINFAFVTE